MSQKHFYKLFCIITLSISCCITDVKAANNINNDFEIKGFHIDLRTQVMTPKALHNFAKELSEFGINTIVMEWEASFPYQKHAVISNQYAYSRKEVTSFIDYCKTIGIKVIPLQQCFGHVEYILRHERYNSLKEDKKDISQVCPLESTENSLLFADLFKDIASLHSSKYIHIGGDETYLLGHCTRCAQKVQEEGKSKLYVDYIKMICGIVMSMGKTPVMWADILLKYPESANELSKNIIFIDWNYGWQPNHFGNIEALQKKGFIFWGAPAIRSHPDNWYITEWEKHFNNQRDFIPYARKAGYKGLIMTSWSTSGLYGFTWDTNYEVLDMKQIRNNYPLSGFRILIASYVKSLTQKEALNPAIFVKEYGMARFGLTKVESQKLWNFFATEQALINSVNPLDLQKSINEAMRLKQLLYSITPRKNRKEFEHYRLMIDLRIFFLRYKEIKAVYNAASFSRGHAKQLLPQIKYLITESQKLDKRFYKLHNGFLHDAEIEQQNEFRRVDLMNIFQRISGISSR